MSSDNIVNHWVDACKIHPIDVIGYLLSSPKTKIDNGYFIHENTPLAFPSVYLNAAGKFNTIEIFWKLLYKTTPLNNAFLYAAATALSIHRIPDTIPRTYEQTQFLKIASVVQDLIGMCPLATSALKCARFDLQLVVSSGYRYLLSKLYTTNKITEFLTTCTTGPWHVVSIGQFFKQLEYFIRNAAIVCIEAPSKVPTAECNIIIDGTGKLLVCKHDMILLVFLFLFSSFTEYINSDRETLKHYQIPVQLSSAFTLCRNEIFTSVVPKSAPPFV